MMNKLIAIAINQYSNPLINPQDVCDFIKGGLQGVPSPVGNGDNAHHFEAAWKGATANKLIHTIVQW